MQATNGSADPRRMRGGMMGCVLALALAVTALVLAPAAANARKPAPGKQVAPETSDYIALGDSISFGYSAERFNIHFPTESPTFFEEGVANDSLKLLRKTLRCRSRHARDAHGGVPCVEGGRHILPRTRKESLNPV